MRRKNFVTTNNFDFFFNHFYFIYFILKVSHGKTNKKKINFSWMTYVKIWYFEYHKFVTKKKEKEKLIKIKKRHIFFFFSLVRHFFVLLTMIWIFCYSLKFSTKSLNGKYDIFWILRIFFFFLQRLWFLIQVIQVRRWKKGNFFSNPFFL